MSAAFAISEPEASVPELFLKQAPVRSTRIQAFSGGHQEDVLAFLSRRPIHTVFMSGLIRDNGLISFGNRGTFYGCRDTAGQLIGVALIGLKTVLEARNEIALEVFADLTPNTLMAHLIRGEYCQIASALRKYARSGH